MSGLSNVFDWDFFWGTFGFILKTVAPFVTIIIAIIAVGLLIASVIRAVRSRA
jgi:ascorbate-specific PTS system EIIC-type component UlaA